MRSSFGKGKIKERILNKMDCRFSNSYLLKYLRHVERIQSLCVRINVLLGVIFVKRSFSVV